jgi:cell fate regulator YaaT (PSP1 superfamily)
MLNIVGIRFKPVTKIYYFDPTNFLNLEVDDRVVVETSRGMELGTVALSVREVPKSEIKGKLKRVIRQATPVDLISAENYRSQEVIAIEKCEEIIAKLDIPIKVIQAEYNFDGSRLLISFISEQRVDFRDLVKDLARSLRTRIEMKQVGARDETKILDGYGRCGRRLCCSSWLTEFHPVSIRMAKQQGLPLAPSEISGLCGRLLCCLAYEDEMYAEMRKEMPKINSQIKTVEGISGTVRGVNVIKETVLLQTEESTSYVEVALADIGNNKDGKAAKPDSPAPENDSTNQDPSPKQDRPVEQDRPAKEYRAKKEDRSGNEKSTPDKPASNKPRRRNRRSKKP